jgi:hypothetical protein
VRLGPLRLTALRSEATVTRAANGDLARRSDFTAGLSVGDTAVSVGNDGVVMAGSNVPVAGVEPLTAALGEAGLSLEYLQAHETDDGVVSAGLVVKSVRQVEGVGTGVVVTTMTIGRTAVSAGRTVPVGGELGELPADVAPLDDAPGESAALSSVEPGQSVQPQPGPKATPGATTRASGTLQTDPPTFPEATVPALEASPPGSEPTQVGSGTMAATPTAPTPSGRFRSVYPLLAAAGFVTVVGQHGLRILVQRGLG